MSLHSARKAGSQKTRDTRAHRKRSLRESFPVSLPSSKRWHKISCVSTAATATFEVMGEQLDSIS